MEKDLTAGQSAGGGRVRAAFLGIDQYADPRIRDLTGARRDATKLWALFADTIDGPEPELITDCEATHTRIRSVVQQTLRSAESDDTVILTFSGHGTRDHRLVAHDTDARALDTTALALDELVEAFKQSRARAILCVLDCCFAGKAPAKVFEESPILREPGTPLALLGGNGRVLLSACDEDEAAYEDPSGKGHGLLTEALLGQLLSATAPVDVMRMATEVQRNTRNWAARFGYNQAPVLFGSTRGGLILPPLRPGRRCRREFPELGRLTTANETGDIAAAEQLPCGDQAQTLSLVPLSATPQSARGRVSFCPVYEGRFSARVDLNGLIPGNGYIVSINGYPGKPGNIELMRYGQAHGREGYADLPVVIADSKGSFRGVVSMQATFPTGEYYVNISVKEYPEHSVILQIYPGIQFLVIPRRIVVIQEPADGSVVEGRGQSISVRIEDPTYQYLYFIVHPLGDPGNYWVQPVPVQQQTGRWSSFCYFGTATQGIGENFQILAVAARSSLFLEEGQILSHERVRRLIEEHAFSDMIRVTRAK